MITDHKWRRNPLGIGPMWVPFSWRPSGYQAAWSSLVEKNKQKLAEMHAKLMSSQPIPASA